MHPLITYIHPSVRTAVWIWALTRGGVWLLGGMSSVPGAPGAGGPLWSWLVSALGALVGPTWSSWALAGLGELGWLAGAVAIYAYIRRDALPQTAERAAWLWGLSPLMCLAVPTQAWGLAACAVCVGAALARSGRHVWSLVALCVAIGLRLELVVLAPAIAWSGARAFEPGRHRAWAPWALGLGPWVAVSAWVFAAVLSAGAAGASTRGLHTEWRSGFALELSWASVPEMILAAWTLACIACVVRFRARTPREWGPYALLAMAIPWMFAGVGQGAIALLAAPPIFAYLGKVGEDPSVERPMLVGSALLWAWGMGAL